MLRGAWKVAAINRPRSLVWNARALNDDYTLREKFDFFLLGMEDAKMPGTFVPYPSIWGGEIQTLENL